MNESSPSADPEGDSIAGTPTSRNPGRRLPVWKKLAFLSVIFLLFLLAVEALLVLLGVSFPLLYQPDEYCATRLRPNLNVRYIEEGNAIVRTNSAGFRDQSRKLNKPDGIFRIAVVGDSFCEAIQVPREESFCYLLEQKLAGRGMKAEVLNFGVSGFGTAQEFEMLRHYVLKYEPDLVILAVFLGNDIGDNSRTINPNQIKPYYDIVEDELLLDDGFRDSPAFLAAQSMTTQLKTGAINSSRILQLANKLYSRWRNRGNRRANIGIGLDPDLYRPPESEQWINAWKVTEALIEAFDRKCRESKSACLVVTLSNPIQVHPDTQVRQSFKDEHQIDTLFYPDNRVTKFCDSRGIRSVQLAGELYEEAKESEPPVFFHGFENTKLGTGHWNQRGHRRVAEILFEYLQQEFFSD